ncbi:hypothetical protein LTS15_009465 [Exophiala xenobiotica]|nr:hypothetical protein LTS15_009465 [Exophiala xenobiotica]
MPTVRSISQVIADHTEHKSFYAYLLEAACGPGVQQTERRYKTFQGFKPIKQHGIFGKAKSSDALLPPLFRIQRGPCAPSLLRFISPAALKAESLQHESASSGLELKEVPIGDPGEVEAAGLCHSDCTIIHGGGDAWISRKPLALGYKVAGRVTRLGAGVSNVQVGDRAVVAPPQEPVCLTEFGNSLGLGRDDGFAEQVVALAKRLVRLEDHVTFPAAVVSTDLVSTA